MDAATLLSEARQKIKSGDEAALKKVMQEWSAVVAEDSENATDCGSDYWKLLLEEVHKDDPGSVRILLTTKSGRQPDLSIIQQILKYDALNSFAVAIEQGWDPDRTIFPGDVQSTLSLATKSPKIAAWLLERGSNPMKKNGKGRTVLDIMAKSGKLETVRQCLDYGGKPNDCYALHMACYFRQSQRMEVIKMLVEEYGATNFNILDLQYDPQNFELMRGAGLGTPLHYAAKNGIVEAVRYLLECGADPEVLNSCGCTALYEAENRRECPAKGKVIEVLRGEE